MKRIKKLIAAALAASLVPQVALAQAMPWEGPLTTIQNALTGSTARIVSIIGIAVFGLSMFMGESGGFMRRTGLIALGATVALAAPRIVGIFG